MSSVLLHAITSPPGTEIAMVRENTDAVNGYWVYEMSRAVYPSKDWYSTMSEEKISCSRTAAVEIRNIPYHTSIRAQIAVFVSLVCDLSVDLRGKTRSQGFRT